MVRQNYNLSLWSKKAENRCFLVSDKDRQTVFITLTVISLVGNFLFFLIQRPDPEPAPIDASESLLPADLSDSSSVV